jgi:hypothetical protein
MLTQSYFFSAGLSDRISSNGRGVENASCKADLLATRYFTTAGDPEKGPLLLASTVKECDCDPPLYFKLTNAKVRCCEINT